jgi:glycosyltransferase involved in cell wall biosynthesis
MERKIKLAISQRIVPEYRVPVFANLASRERIDLTVFYGKGFKTGSQVNSTNIKGLCHKKLFTIFMTLKKDCGAEHMRVFHPTLLFNLLFGKFDVVIVEPTTNFYNDIFVFLYCKIFRKKFIWYDAGSQPKERRTRARRLIDPIVTIFIKHADAFITYNSFADQSLMRYWNIQSEKIFRAQNTVDTSNYEKAMNLYYPRIKEIKQKLGLQNCKVSMYIGGIERRKKINNLITATSNLNQKGIKAKTLIVGEGPDKEWVLENMTDYEKEHTVFAGKHIDDSVLYFMLADVVVLPSQGGLSVTQAFACGKPFIGSEEIEHGGIKDYITDNYNGFLVKNNNIKDLENKLERVFTDPELYTKLSMGALNTSKNITVNAMVDGIVNAVFYSLRKDVNIQSIMLHKY